MAENRLSTISQFEETTPNDDDVILVSHKEGGQYVSNKAKISSLPFVNFKDYASKYEAGLMQVGAGLSVDGYGKVSVPTATASIDGLMSKEDKVKLNGIEEGANKYVLPPATDSTLGGIIIGSKLSIDNGKLDVDVSKLGLQSYYLPLSGGTMTGTIRSDITHAIARNGSSSFLEIGGGSTYLSGAYLTLHGKDCTAPGKEKGGFTLVATDGNNQTCSLSGNPNGKLTWNSKNIVRSINSNLTADINGNVIVPVATAKINGLMSKDDKAKIDSFSSTYIPVKNIVNNPGIQTDKVVSQYLLSSQLSNYAPLTAIYYPSKELTSVTIHLSVDGGNDADAAKYIINHEDAEREAHPFKTLPAAMNALQNIRSNSSSFNWIIKVWPGKYVFGGDNDNQGMPKNYNPSTSIFHPDCFGAGEGGNQIQIVGQHTTSGTPMYNDVIFEFYENEEPRITAATHLQITSRCKITNITFQTTNIKQCKLDENGKPKGYSTRWNLITIGGAYVQMENVSLRYASTGINLNSASTLRVYRALDVQYCRAGIADSDKNSIMQFFCGGFWENNKFTYYDNDTAGHCRFLNCNVGIYVQNFTILHGNATSIFRMLFNNCNAAFNIEVDSHLQMTVNDTNSDHDKNVPQFQLTIKKHLDQKYDAGQDRNGFDFDTFKAGTKNLQTNSTTFAILEKQGTIKSDHIIYETIS